VRSNRETQYQEPYVPNGSIAVMTPDFVASRRSSNCSKHAATSILSRFLKLIFSYLSRVARELYKLSLISFPVRLSNRCEYPENIIIL
jgi:hypothetical protein